MLLLKQNSTRVFFITIFLVLALLPVLFPLIRHTFFVSDDGEWMIIRFSAFFEALRSGQFPVRFLMRLNQGYGYPVADFLYPGFMYIGVPIHIFGFSFTETIKILMGGSIVVSAIFCFFWLRRFFDEFASFMGALFYGYAPYHLFDLYKRGSLGELLAMAMIPFVLWQLERKSFFWSSFGLGLLLILHNTLSLFFFVLLVFYMLLDIAIGKNRRKIAERYIATCVIGIGLSAFFWIPAVFDLQYTVFAMTPVANWRAYFSDLQLVGVQTYLIFIIALVFFFTKRVNPSRHRLTILFLFVGLLATFFATNSSESFWQILPVSFVQFPFRFLSVTILAASFLTAFLFSVLSKNEKIAMVAILVVLNAISFWPMFSSISFTDKPDSFYATNLDTTTVRNEYMPIWVKEYPTGWPRMKVVTRDGNITHLISKPNSISFQAESSKQQTVSIQTIYFPGWQVKVDGRSSQISYNNPQGIIDIAISEGKHDVSLFFSETPIRLFSDALTIVSFVLLCWLSIFQRKKLSS